jgi:peptidase M28-like protein/fibronectin type III domain protein
LNRIRVLPLSVALLLVICLPGGAQQVQISSKPNPQIEKILGAISAANIEAIMRKLVGFGTRHTLSSQDDPARGIGAAWRWIKEEMDRYSRESGGRLIVTTDEFIQQPTQRVAQATKVVNVVATLSGSQPESKDRIYVVSGHYDSCVCSQGMTDATSDAPGASDDASGTAVVMEMARVMSKYQFDATLVFLAVAGEEQGLLGAAHWAEEAKAKNLNVAAMFTNDIVGNNFEVTLVFRRDRYGRGGDHNAFLQRGYPAVRFTEPNEDFTRQHQRVRDEDGVKYGDVIEMVDFPYIAQVARVNAAAMASMALAPAPPSDVSFKSSRQEYNTTLTWKPNAEPDVSGYRVVWRETYQPFWQRGVDVGNVTEYVMKGLSKDDYFFAVQAIDKDGNASAPSFPKSPPRTRRQ